MRLGLTLLAAASLASCARSSGEGDVVARVTAWLHDLEGDEATATKAVDALSALGSADAAAVPVLMEALACPPEHAGDADAEPGRHDAAPLDHEHHDHGDHEHGACNDHVVLAAARALGAIGGPAVSPLLARLRDDTEPNRTFAGHALSRMAASATPALLAAIDDPDPRIRVAVVGALRTMDPPPADAVPALAKRVVDPDAEVRLQTADALGHFGAPAVAVLLPALDDADPRVRASVASAFRAIGPAAREATATLRAHLDDPAPSVRLNAAAALGAIGADDAATVNALAAALGDGDHTVRWGAAQALGRLGPAASAARPSLERARSDVHPLVRTAAADVLTRLGTP